MMTWGIILAARSAPEVCCSRSPDGAKRNPGAAFRLIDRSPDYAALHPGYNERKKGDRTLGIAVADGAQ